MFCVSCWSANKTLERVQAAVLCFGKVKGLSRPSCIKKIVRFVEENYFSEQLNKELSLTLPLFLKKERKCLVNCHMFTVAIILNY